MAEPLEEIQESILERLHAGEPLDRPGVLAAHPEHAEALRRFFSVLDLIEVPPSEETPTPPRLGEFEIVREIGRGGMGVVYEAIQTSLKRRVALKVLPPAFAHESKLRARFQREAEVAARLRHPNIVPVFSVGEVAGTPFFAMEFVEGRALADPLRERREGKDAGLPPAGAAWRRWAVETVVRIADALAYAHEQGIVHRDVKPGNIVLDRDGTPRLTDFGLALDVEAAGLTLSGEVFGSPYYMSPEQAFRRRQPIDRRTDVYSLGVTLYEILTGRLPYDGATSAEYLAALDQGRLLLPRTVDATIPPALERVLLRALRKDPAERYSDAAAFAEDLRAALEGRPVVAPPRGRRRRWVAVGAGLGLGLVGWGAFSLDLIPLTREPSAKVAEGSSIPPTSEEIERIADGAHPEGARAIERWIRPRVRMRHVLARQEPGEYRCEVALEIPSGGPAGSAILVLWEVSADGAGWRSIPGVSVAGIGAGPGTLTLPVSVDPGAFLAGTTGRDSVALRHRAKVRVFRAPPGGLPADLATLAGGTVYTWIGPLETVFLYDRYPSDYPEAVSNPETDLRMKATLTPDHVRYRGLRKGAEREITLSLEIYVGPGPIPAACEVDLFSPDRGQAIASAEFARGGADDSPDPGTTRRASSDHVPFRLQGDPDGEQARFLLDLESGKAKEVRLLFRPSRRVALTKPDFDRFWAGTLDVTVPVLPADAPAGPVAREGR